MRQLKCQKFLSIAFSSQGFSAVLFGHVCDSYRAEPDCSLTVVSCQKPDVAGLAAVERSVLDLLPGWKTST